MFIPIGDYPNPAGYRPWVTWGLIASNVLVFLLVTLPLGPAYGPFVEQFGYVSGRPSAVALFTSMFLHGGFMHLGGNMLFLYIFGNNVEHRVGRVGYLFLYLASGVIGTLVFATLGGPSDTPLVGASGAISGVLGCYFVFFPRNVVKVGLILFIFLQVIHVPARWVLGFYLVVQNILPLLFDAQSNVAYGAHFGGFVAGAAAAWVLERKLGRAPLFKRRPKKSAVRARVITPDRTFAGAPIDAAIANGDRAHALAQFQSLGPVAMVRDHPNAALTIAQWLADEGQIDVAADLLRKLLGRGRLPSEQQARVFLTLGLVRLKQGQHVSAYQHLMSVFDYDPEPEVEERARRALATLRH